MTPEEFRTGEIAELGAALQDRKQTANVAALSSISALLEELRQCLGGARLVGLPRLSRFAVSSRYRGPAYHGVRLRTKSPDEPLPRPENGEEWGRVGLVLNAEGELVLARQSDLGSVQEQPATPGDLKAEDLSMITEGVHRALQYARNYAQERGAVLDGIASLADDLGAMLRARRGRR